jgi:NAD+ diphosphatase
VRWTGGEPGGTDPELQDVRWFDREQIAAAALRNAEWEHEELEAEVQLPPRSAIARRLIDGWLERG